MHKISTAIILLALSSVSLNAASASKKADICHKGRDISVSMSAMSAHENHGDTLGECEDTQDTSDSDSDKADNFNNVVVMMRCEAIVDNGVTVVSFSSSVDIASIQPVEPVDCAVALADLLDRGLKLRSVTGGSSGDGTTVKLYTDYLLIGKVDSDSD